MSIRAGSIITVAGRNVVDRLQSVGLGDTNLPIETIREVGNDLVVDKVPGEPDYTFSMESFDVSTDVMAWLHGAMGSQAANLPPGSADPAGTEYKWEDCQFVNVTSPWKTDTGSAGGHIGAGIVIPTYYPTRMQYAFGVTDNAKQTLELAGGAFYYAKTPPVEELAAGDGTIVDFATSEAAWAHRIGGAGGTVYRYILGVLVDGQIQIEGVDYTVSVAPTVPPAPGVATITFATAPANAAQVKFVYFTNIAKTYPQAVNADATLKPGAVRGRDIHIVLDRAGANLRFSGVQSIELNATVDGEVQREMGNDQITGRVVNGTDASGTVTVRPNDINHFFQALADVTGVAQTEVYGYFNLHDISVDIEIHDPRASGTVLKTLYVPDGQFQPPGTPGRVNQATDFAFQFNSVNGTFSEFKGARP